MREFEELTLIGSAAPPLIFVLSIVVHHSVCVCVCEYAMHSHIIDSVTTFNLNEHLFGAILGCQK